jgi:protocatechuate 3,4-dioxygenase beta subunit
MTKRTGSPDLGPDGTRRALVRTMFGIPVVGLAGYAAYSLTAAGTAFELPPTLACGDDDDEPTPSQTEGPYFRPRSPERSSLLEGGMSGTRLIVSGQVLSTFCAPVAGALLDFWQADAGGEYDNRGFRLRGHQFTGPDGRFTLETVVPGLYSGRTRHLHVKVQARGGRILTTQLYFPNEPGNARDGIFSPKLLMSVAGAGDAQHGQFNFVLRT